MNLFQWSLDLYQNMSRAPAYWMSLFSFSITTKLEKITGLRYTILPIHPLMLSDSCRMTLGMPSFDQFRVFFATFLRAQLLEMNQL